MRPAPGAGAVPAEHSGRRGDATHRPRIALTVGDPRGIRPEVTARALADPSVSGVADFHVVGPTGTAFAPHTATGTWLPHGGTPLAGELAGVAIERAVEMALSGEVDGIVTAPIDTAALLAGGYSYPGHTEMLASLAGGQTAMMLASDRLRVVLATTHIPLSDVVRELSADVIERTARLRLPSIAHHEGFAEDGGLLSYGPSFVEGWRRVPYFVDRILKGARPSDLPIEQPTKFDLIINLRTAKALGLRIPDVILVRANRLIQ